MESRLLAVPALKATVPDNTDVDAEVPVKVGMVVPYTGVTLVTVEMVPAAITLLDAARELVLNTSDTNAITVDTDLGGITPDKDHSSITPDKDGATTNPVGIAPDADGVTPGRCSDTDIMGLLCVAGTGI